MVLVWFVIVFEPQRSPLEVESTEKLRTIRNHSVKVAICGAEMYKNKRGESRSKKRKAEDEYSLQTILDDDASNDAAGGEVAEPRAAARNAEKNDESVRFRNVSKSSAVFNVFRFLDCRRRVWS